MPKRSCICCLDDDDDTINDSIHSASSLDEFIDRGLTDPDNSGNLLDSQSLLSSVPSFIVYVHPFLFISSGIDVIRLAR